MAKDEKDALLQENGFYVLRFLAEDIKKDTSKTKKDDKKDENGKMKIKIDSVDASW